ncbi:MAG: endonuclease [Candidatus Doudnabacteria bacterium RIFCSPLOWO2_02_FULL_49_13]|uniref:Endonuclease n=1 Tax=Candidatus Doudnabacteria bacterium RIFCSPHIGHO2_12_FULL_48_16 TaxID=1817838 RepID=A0A1F5PKC3_9BACT|nr:MAG: endonuclease [Candidatus Doudnabacteria bacterium RIFCSPHIGHO2_02_FULL_49_24]OGE88656.1 MAG: endonuclease [Candidatus Doudnabacteria bacterium RIFCSPHIGHO2_01_FULL_50_67]OGE90341.1 MAG: endonuclease [Candidatus Doudnabacteria bacterium RIFCSPHIGHO2_12_FULL_48_16]OGE97048.1 MAG: endonuclease [Candidatus Doudnabacteria bacterium RIFCSPLOWO2_01_FULL_49_40]OGF02397.1 MAG: endonuclease [Candidatus Doudnabacteria bacterium RIFCSPLOWO2_02_FULL_49_13]OGF03451.1 MAG: endonuclease [Candidatus Do
MRFYAYILKSQKHGRYYVGSTNDLQDRLKRHNAGYNKSTKDGVPWELVYSETFLTKQEAYKRELKIKSYKGGEAFKRLINL